MNLRRLLILFIMIGFYASCSSITYWTDHQEDVDFSDYSTYKIDDQCSDYNPGINPIHQQRIKNAIEIALRDLNYSKSEDADLSIKYFVMNETKYFYEHCLPEYDDVAGGGQCIDKVYTYEEGTLVIDFIDIRRNLAVWHGGANGDSWDNMSNADETINEMVGRIMQEYKELAKSSVYAYGHK